MSDQEDAAREFALNVVALEVLRRAAEDFWTVQDGWAHFPDLTEENWERAVSRVYDMVAQIAQVYDLPDPLNENAGPEGFWNLLQFKAQQDLGETT